jgi:Fur family peroxide stress response transcriptional regulator
MACPGHRTHCYLTIKHQYDITTIREYSLLIGRSYWEGRSLVDHPSRLNDLISKLRERGFRLTPQRMAVLKILAASKQHPSVEQIYHRMKPDFPMTSLATVYRTVALLKEMGEVLELGFSDDSNRYDGGRPNPHPHVICIKCKKIVHPELDIISRLPLEVAQKTGYRIVHHRVDFFGICPACQGKE